MSALLPPPPQDVAQRTIVAQAAVKIILKSLDENKGIPVNS